MPIYKCPGCKKIRFNGRWVDLNTVDPKELTDGFTDYLCRTCRDDKQLRGELLNDGVEIKNAI